MGLYLRDTDELQYLPQPPEEIARVAEDLAAKLIAEHGDDLVLTQSEEETVTALLVAAFACGLATGAAEIRQQYNVGSKKLRRR